MTHDSYFITICCNDLKANTHTSHVQNSQKTLSSFSYGALLQVEYNKIFINHIINAPKK